MKNRLFNLKIIIDSFILVTDGLTFLALNSFFSSAGLKLSPMFPVIYWTISLFFLFLVSRIKYNQEQRDPRSIIVLYGIATSIIILYIPKLVFTVFLIINGFFNLIILSFVKLVTFLSGKLMVPYQTTIFSWLGLTIAFILLLLLIYGILIGRFRYKTDQVELLFKNLPPNFNGLKIVQISDIHLGSFTRRNKRKLEKATWIINGLKPDLILFTGDLVNNFSEEALDWIETFAVLNARYGKFSILGNHDYGDYWDWKTEEEKEDNFDLLLRIHEKMGFRLLKNEEHKIYVGNQKIAIIGVENWGRPPFYHYGNLDEANKSDQGTFKILLSHDPTHWEEEVQFKDDIPLTLSGHTHAMQMGFRIGSYKWSPVQYIYKKWAGLYNNNGRYLYVNRGLGFIGYMGRVGMPPEITLFTLQRST